MDHKIDGVAADWEDQRRVSRPGSLEEIAHRLCRRIIAQTLLTSTSVTWTLRLFRFNFSYHSRSAVQL